MSYDDLQKRLTNFSNGVILKPDRTSQSSLEELALKNGCIMLGRDAGRGNKYVTRFKVERGMQTEAAHHGVCMEEYFPCCVPEKNPNSRKRCWNFVRSEALVLTLHMSVLIIGVLKEALKLKTVDEDLHLVHSVIETFVSSIVILIRIAGTRHGFKNLKKLRRDQEVVGSMGEIRRVGLQRGVKIFTAFGIFLIIADWVCFFMFMYVPGLNLTYTILSNNAVLLFITITSNQALGRIGHETAKIKEDHHKAVIYETVLLLTEAAWANTKEDKKEVNERVERFCKALRDTEMFAQPDYITCPRELQPHWDAITTMEVVSMV